MSAANATGEVKLSADCRGCYQNRGDVVYLWRAESLRSNANTLTLDDPHD